jgi:hypothetical protein
MITIKFSSYYLKHPPGFQHSVLLQVLPVELSSLSQAFREYDTTKEDGLQYPLPKYGKYIILFLAPVSNPFCLFTTIRSAFSKDGRDKLEYYRKHVGEEVKCVVEKPHTDL